MIVLNRYSGEVHEELQETGTREVRGKIDNGRKVLEILAGLTTYDLSDALYKISSEIRKNSSMLSRNITAETGKPIKYSREEVESASKVFVSAAEEISNINNVASERRPEMKLDTRFSFSSNIPLGLVLSFHPFTEPLYSVSSRVAASIATGNSIIMKPSSIAPTTSLKLLDIINGSGLPEDSVQAVISGRNSKATHALIGSKNFDLFSFSGKVENSYELTKRSSFNRMLSETGNSSPVIVWSDADLDVAAESIARSAFRFQGQTPVRAQCIITRQESMEYLKNRLIEEAQQLNPGDPLNEETDFGALISQESAEKVEKQINLELEKGSYLVSGGHRENAFLEPTIIENVRTSSDLVKNQILAPIVTLHQTDSFKHAIGMANETGVSNQAGLFTSDINLIMTAFEKLRCSTLVINDSPALTSGIISSSGNASALNLAKEMRYLMKNMVEEKIAILKR